MTRSFSESSLSRVDILALCVYLLWDCCPYRNITDVAVWVTVYLSVYGHGQFWPRCAGNLVRRRGLLSDRAVLKRNLWAMMHCSPLHVQAKLCQPRWDPVCVSDGVTNTVSQMTFLIFFTLSVCHKTWYMWLNSKIFSLIWNQFTNFMSQR